MGARWLEVEGQVRRGCPAAAWELTAETRAAAWARTLTRQTLQEWGVADPVDVDDIVLMVDELITNAVVHGAGPVRLRLTLDGSQIAGEVTDDSPAGPRDTGIDPQVLDWSEAGRGLLLVGALATEFGARPAHPGKTVWFTRLLRGANGHTPAGTHNGARTGTRADATPHSGHPDPDAAQAPGEDETGPASEDPRT